MNTGENEQMATLIDMPKLSDTMEEGGVSEWFKKEGDFVEEGELLLAIETDKATMEYASPEEGTLLKILVKEGATVPLRKPIAVIGDQGESFNLSDLTGASPSEEKVEAAQGQENNPNKVDPSPQTEAVPPITLESNQDRIKASPLAKKIAADKGINLATIKGSGPNGRIIQRDIDSWSGTQTNQTQANSSFDFAYDVKKPHSMMRKTIAKRLLAGKNEAPHFYLTVSADMTAMMEWRKKLNQDPRVASKELPKVSLNDLIMLATAKALKRHPEVNASWHDEYIVEHGNVHVAMAVALPSGLITPVVPSTDRLGVWEIARKTKELAAKAKDGKLQPEEYSGGTFTISNLGMTAVESFTAIINPPQACILAVGTCKPTPHVDAEGSLVVQTRMKMTMSCDHRVVDGMVGAKFLETLITFLENPLFMLS